MSEPSDQTEARKPGKGRWPRLLIGLLVFACVVGVTLASLVDRQISAPQWLREKIVTRINSEQSDFGVSIGDIALVMQEGWKPRFLLSDLSVSDAQGAPLVNLSEMAGVVAFKPLLKGQLHPSMIQLSGARIILRRDATGGFDLALGDTTQPVEKAPNLAALVEGLDSFLLRKHFVHLKQVEADNLTVQFEDKRVNRAWTVDGGRLALTRDGDEMTIRGDFALLGGRDYATTLAMSYSGRIGSTAAELGLSFEDMAAEDIAGQSASLAWLSALKAPISGALRTSAKEDGTFGPLNATLQIGEGVLQPTDATEPIAFTSARSYFAYEPATQTIEFDELSVVSDWVTARAEGRATLVGVSNDLPQEILGRIEVTQLTANPNEIYPEPVSLEGASMDVRLGIDPFVLTLGQLSLRDQGSNLVLQGELKAEAEGWDLALDGQMDTLTPERLITLWPPEFKDGTRSWISENVETADLKNLQIALRVAPRQKPEIYLGFDFDGLKTRFMKKMPPIQGASGHASLLDNRFSITAIGGEVTAAQGGRIDIAGTSFIVPDVRIRNGPARVRLRTDSTITAALSLLDEEPLSVMQKAGRPVTLADGRAVLSGQLDFLLKKKLETSEVAFDVTGNLSGVRSEVLVPGRTLSARTLDVSASNELLRVGGRGQIGSVPFAGAWQTALGASADGSSRFAGGVELSERFTQEFRIGLPPGAISGAGNAEIAIELARDVSGRFSLSSDLAGVGLKLRELGWSLAEGATGTLLVEGALGQPPSIDRVVLDAGGLTARGSVSLHPNGELNQASFERVIMDDWLSAPVDLIGRGAGVAPAIHIRGGRVDMRQTTLGAGGSDGTGPQGAGGPITLELNRLQISDGIRLTNFRAQLDNSRGLDGTFSGKVNGGAVIRGRVIPRDGRSAFRIQSDDAGAVMVSAGMLQNARDGKMDLILTPAREKGSYNGQLGIDDFRIKNIPSMAALLNAVSVIGILEQLQGDGLHFGRVDARFHLSPDRVVLTEGSAVGPSLGISMDGYYYMASKQMDMQGVFSPIYLVNAIGGIFTRKGEGLFGFTYTIKGPAASPTVSVNPLSVLTPGMFREFFRRSAPNAQRTPAKKPDTGRKPQDEN